MREHIVAMTRRYTAKAAFSVATCACGTRFELPVANHRKMDRLIRDHWRCVVAAGKREAAQ